MYCSCKSTIANKINATELLLFVFVIIGLSSNNTIVEVRSSRHGPGASLLNERGVSLQCVSDSCANHNSCQ